MGLGVKLCGSSSKSRTLTQLGAPFGSRHPLGALFGGTLWVAVLSIAPCNFPGSGQYAYVVEQSGCGKIHRYMRVEISTSVDFEHVS